MTALLLGVFVLQLTIHVVTSIGASSVNDILWILYNRLPTPTTKTVQHVNKQRIEVLRLTKELKAISAQDDFARWAKLRRQVDKATAEHEKLAASLKASRSQFDTIASTLRWLGTTGVRFFLQFWFAKTAIYWVPVGWLPYYAEWILSFPKAPLGSISIQCWWIACASIIKLVADAFTAAWVLAAQPRGLREKEAMAFPGSSMPEKTGFHEKEL